MIRTIGGITIPPDRRGPCAPFFSFLEIGMEISVSAEALRVIASDVKNIEQSMFDPDGTPDPEQVRRSLLIAAADLYSLSGSREDARYAEWLRQGNSPDSCP